MEKDKSDSTTTQQEAGASTNDSKLTVTPKDDAKHSASIDVTTSTNANCASCKKGTKKNDKKTTKHSKKGKKKAVVDSDTSESESSSSEDESTEEDEETTTSDASDSDGKRRKKKSKKSKSKDKKRKDKTAKKHTKKKVTSEDSSEEDDSTDEEQQQKNAKAKARAKAIKAAKKKLQDADEESDDAEDDPSNVTNLKAQIAALKAQQANNTLAAARRNRLARLRDQDLDIGNERLGKAKKKNTDKRKKKRASKVAFKRVDQLWDNNIHNYKLTETIDDSDADEWDQYIFTVRRKFDWEHKYQDTYVDIRSKPLKAALQHIMSGVKNISLVEETPHLSPKTLFLYLEESRAYVKQLKALSKSAKKKKERQAAANKAAHLKILVKYLDKDFADTKKTLYPMLENNMITFDLLWALYKPNTIAYAPTYGDTTEPRALKIDYAVKESSLMKGIWYLIEGQYLEYDGKSFGMGIMHAEVPSFQGARKISSLDCYPLQYHKNPEELKTKLIERGKKFVALKGMNYRMHKGMAYTKRKRQILKININGRVMVDPAIHRRINPNYPISTVRPKEDADLYEPSDAGSDEEGCGCGSSNSESEGGDKYTPSASEEAKDEHRRPKFRVIKDNKGQHHLVEIETDENGEEVMPKEQLGDLGKETGECFTDEELLIASPVVLGFAFSEKLWLEFTISGISDIVWNEGAFDSLVLPDNQKKIVKALVSSHAFHASQNIDDIIAGKGKGLVAVLHGSPGTGKTLTAEGIADLLKCPLYMVSAGDLGTDPRVLEKELQNILDIAHSWGALLLLDEADVFLEKRSIHDIHRNALVSIFLRLLEYFQGILFLTTNRVETFDEAFVSRIHLSLKYEGLSQKARKTVWKTFIQRVKEIEGSAVANITDRDYDDLSKRNINGRQIKNLTRAAQALAVDEKVPLSLVHIKRVVELAETFEVNVTGGNPDAMRSVYT